MNKLKPMRTVNRTRLLFALTLALATAACESIPPLSEDRHVESSEDAANVFVAAYPAVPWTTIASKLEPKHNLTTADARTMAALTTQAQVSQFLSTFSASLGLALPLRTNNTVTTTDAAGTVATTGTRTLASPSIPSAGSPTSGISEAALSADLTKTPFALGLDGASQLQIGTGIFQLAQILDNQISASIAPRGYEAHLITLQVNLQPTGRNLPYDAYINVSLLPASWQKAVDLSQANAITPDAMPPVIMYPLVISDAMESSSVGKSLEVARQAALQLSGIVSNVGLAAGLGGGTNRLESLLGSDRNSLVTVGRVSDHTLRIRLGAAQQGSRRLALVPRTHNISLVVFTRADKEDEKFHIDKLAVITETRFFDVDTGKALPSRRSGTAGREALRDGVLDALTGYGYRLHQECNTTAFASLDLLSALDRGDYAQVSSCLVEPVEGAATQEVVPTASQPASSVAGLRLLSPVSSGGLQSFVFSGSPERMTTAVQSKGSVLDGAREARLRRLLARLMTLQTDSRYSKLMVELTRFKRQVASLPLRSQFAQLSDDGKTTASVTLRGGAYLKPDSLKARMAVAQSVGNVTTTHSLLASGLSVDGSGEALSLSFPSPTAAGLASTVVQGTPTHFLVEVTLLDSKGVISSVEPYVVKVAGASKEKGPDNPVRASTGTIVATRAGTARVVLTVGEWDAAKAGKLVLAVTGADVEPSGPHAVDPTLGGIVIAEKTVVTLNLSNLSPRNPVQIQTLAKEKPVGQALLFVIERTAPGVGALQ